LYSFDARKDSLAWPVRSLNRSIPVAMFEASGLSLANLGKLPPVNQTLSEVVVVAVVSWAYHY